MDTINITKYRIGSASFQDSRPAYGDRYIMDELVAPMLDAGNHAASLYLAMLQGDDCEDALRYCTDAQLDNVIELLASTHPTAPTYSSDMTYAVVIYEPKLDGEPPLAASEQTHCIVAPFDTEEDADQFISTFQGNHAVAAEHAIAPSRLTYLITPIDSPKRLLRELGTVGKGLDA